MNRWGAEAAPELLGNVWPRPTGPGSRSRVAVKSEGHRKRPSRARRSRELGRRPVPRRVTVPGLPGDRVANRWSVGGTVSVGGGTVSVGGGTVSVGGGTVSVGGGTVSVGGGTVSVGGGTVSVGGGTVSVGGGTVSVGGGTVSVGGGTVSVGGGSVSVGGGTGSVGGGSGSVGGGTVSVGGGGAGPTLAAGPLQRCPLPSRSLHQVSVSCLRLDSSQQRQARAQMKPRRARAAVAGEAELAPRHDYSSHRSRLCKVRSRFMELSREG